MSASSMSPLRPFRSEGDETSGSVTSDERADVTYVTARDHDQGVVTVVLPVMSADGHAVAAAASAAPVRRMERRGVIAKRLPVLRMTSRGVTEMLWRCPELTHSVGRD